MPKDFDYHNLERQTAYTFEEIRPDHQLRYQMVPLVVPHLTNNSIENILDIFCGNGYGSAYLAKHFTQSSVLGIDGCKQAIDVANTHFNEANTLYAFKYFPCQLPVVTYDIITCFESIEHVDDPDLFFQRVAAALKPGGLLFVSTPNEDVMPFAVNADIFKHHTRHFTANDMQAFGKKNNLELVMVCGQDVYNLHANGRWNWVNETLSMVPSVDIENPQFLICVYKK